METDDQYPAYISNRTEKSYIVTYRERTKEFTIKFGNPLLAWKEAEAWMRELDAITTLGKLKQGDPFYFVFEGKTQGRYVGKSGRESSFCPLMGSKSAEYDQKMGRESFLNTAEVVPIENLTPEYPTGEWRVSDYQYHNAFHIFRVDGIRGSIQSCLPQNEAEGVANLMVSGKEMYETLKKITQSKSLGNAVQLANEAVAKVDGK